MNPGFLACVHIFAAFLAFIFSTSGGRFLFLTVSEILRIGFHSVFGVDILFSLDDCTVKTDFYI